MVKLQAALHVTRMVQQVAELVAAEQTGKGQAVAAQWMLLPAQAGEVPLLVLGIHRSPLATAHVRQHTASNNS
jgi:hypothetical protein